MPSPKDSIRERITADHAASMAIFNAFTPEQWAKPVPSETEAPWTGRDVLAHLAVSEGGQLGQITRCIAGEVTVPDNFDLARFNRSSVKKQADKSVADLLKEIETGHAQVLDTLGKIADEDLAKTGRHARGDILTVEQFFLRITEHRLGHANELKAAVGA